MPTDAPVTSREIPRQDWRNFLDSFSRQHEGWLATIEVHAPLGRLVIAEDRPLEGVCIDGTDLEGRIDIIVSESSDQHLAHPVEEPAHIRFLQTTSGADAGLEIIAADGTRTVIEFRAPIRPEMLDGKVA
jgi:hypothetical protein